jgi:hypothetical protein
MHPKIKQYWARLRPQYEQKAREIREDVERAFTEHPHMTGETYLEHLWFTVRMAGRFLYTTTVLVIHGIFPFLLTKAASKEIEAIYKIMRNRVPKARRDVIDVDYQV